MKAYFSRILEDPRGLAILDLVDYFGQGKIITRINVPEAHRGKGIGRELLTECLAEADATGTILWLELSPSGGLTKDQLEAWYRRHGFRGAATGVMKRIPK